MLFVLLFIILQTAPEELHESIHIKVIAAGLGKTLPATAFQDVAWLGVDAVVGIGNIGIDLAYICQRPVTGCNPVALVSLLLVIAVKGHYDIVIAEYLQNPGVRPHAVLHLATVDAAVTGEVYEQGLAHALRISSGLLQLEEALKVVRKMEDPRE